MTPRAVRGLQQQEHSETSSADHHSQQGSNFRKKRLILATGLVQVFQSSIFRSNLPSKVKDCFFAQGLLRHGQVSTGRTVGPTDFSEQLVAVSLGGFPEIPPEFQKLKTSSQGFCM